MRQFGEPATGVAARERPGAYAVVFTESGRSEVLLVEWRGRFFLPGGGIQPGESAAAAVRRELLEETGHDAVTLAPLGSAAQYVGDSDLGRSLNKLCEFFVVTVAGRPVERVDRDHSPVWVAADIAADRLAEEASAWAVRQALRDS